MADIFVSYTSSDRDWAFWIGQELEKLGHAPHVHEWEIPAGGNIAAWMEERHHNADHMLCVISKVYLTKDYSSWERQAAQWAAASKRPNFALPVFVEECEASTLLAPFKRCDLHGLSEKDARARLAAYLAPAAKPSGRARFPGVVEPVETPPARPEQAAFPGGRAALSNVPIAVPRHFLGRDDALEAIDAALKRYEGRVAITALHGLRGVGKTTLAAAYAELRRADYRATWWIRAQTEPTMRADLVALGVRLGWVAADEKEEPALTAVRERLRDEGERLLLIYDNAVDFGERQALSAERRRGARAGDLQRPRLARHRRSGRNPRLAVRMSARTTSSRAPGATRSAPRRKLFHRRSAGCHSPTSRRRPIASGSTSRLPNIASASTPRRRGCSTRRKTRRPNIMTA